MKFLDKLERKFGKYSISNLIFYIITLYVIGFVIDVINPHFYTRYLMLDVEKVLQGQVWRMFTFIIQPTGNKNIFFIFIELYLYYTIGTSLENVWGAFKFNLYYFSGILFNVIAIFVLYFVTGSSYVLGLTYINRSMFFAFAAVFPDIQFLLFFIIPIKVKHLAIFNGLVYIVDIVMSFVNNRYYVGIAILISLGNFFLYFFNTRNYKHYTPKEIKRRRNFRRQVKNSAGNVVDFNGRKRTTMHKCSVCRRTELDDEDLEFRFCSKCDGNYEYCSDHLFTHEHVKK